MTPPLFHKQCQCATRSATRGSLHGTDCQAWASSGLACQTVLYCHGMTQALLDSLEDDLKYAIEVEGKMSVADIANYDQVSSACVRQGADASPFNEQAHLLASGALSRCIPACCLGAGRDCGGAGGPAGCAGAGGDAADLPPGRRRHVP